MDRKQSYNKQQQHLQQQQQQQLDAAAANMTSQSQLHFFQTSPHSSSLPLPWMIPPYQMMVLPQGMSQSFLAQNVLALQDGHVLVTPSVDDSNGIQMMSTEELTEALLRQQQQQQQNSSAPPIAHSSQQYHHTTSTSSQQHFAQHATVNAHSGSSVGASSAQGGYRYSSAPSAAVQQVKPDVPCAPKRPLTPYMMFSKSIWPQVKAANTHLSSVCEIGAVIGALWRDLDQSEKQKYNDQFSQDKDRYDTELRTYLKTTGLHASDLIKPKVKRKDVRPSTSISTAAFLQSQQLARTGQAAWPPQQLVSTSGAATASVWAQQQQGGAGGGTSSVGDGGVKLNGPSSGVMTAESVKAAEEALARSNKLEEELVRVRAALSEKTAEAIHKSAELEVALCTIEMYKQRDQARLGAEQGQRVGGDVGGGGEGKEASSTLAADSDRATSSERVDSDMFMEQPPAEYMVGDTTQPACNEGGVMSDHVEVHEDTYGHEGEQGATSSQDADTSMVAAMETTQGTDDTIPPLYNTTDPVGEVGVAAREGAVVDVAGGGEEGILPQGTASIESGERRGMEDRRGDEEEDVFTQAPSLELDDEIFKPVVDSTNENSTSAHD